ncbi:hypothetical protein ACFLVF_02350 [Chloroflexota bacterium]
MKICAEPIRGSQIIKTKEALVKSFSPSPSKNTEELANKWLARNAGKIKVYDIVKKRAKNHSGTPCLEIIYHRKIKPYISPDYRPYS